MDAAAQLYLLGDGDCTAPNYLLLQPGLGAGLDSGSLSSTGAGAGAGADIRSESQTRHPLSCSGVLEGHWPGVWRGEVLLEG